MTSLWRNVTVNVVANSNWSCLLISAPKVHWTVQPTAARQSGRFNTMHGALRALHVSQQCLYEICLQMLEKERWPPNNSPDLNGIEISWLGSGAKSYFETFFRSQKQFLNQKSHHGEDMGLFSQSQLMKLSWVLQVLWQEYVNGEGRHSKHLSPLKKVFALTAFALSWIVETIFDNVSSSQPLSCHDKKAA